MYRTDTLSALILTACDILSRRHVRLHSLDHRHHHRRHRHPVAGKTIFTPCFARAQLHVDTLQLFDVAFTPRVVLWRKLCHVPAALTPTPALLFSHSLPLFNRFVAPRSHDNAMPIRTMSASLRVPGVGVQMRLRIETDPRRKRSSWKLRACRRAPAPYSRVLRATPSTPPSSPSATASACDNMGRCSLLGMR